MAKKKIFVIDDDQGILDVVKIILEESDFFVTLISNPKNLLKKIKQEKPDIVLIDIWISGYDGKELAMQIKQDSSLDHIPVILMSANNQVQQLSVAVDADDYIEKPFDIDDLVATIRKHLPDS